MTNLRLQYSEVAGAWTMMVAAKYEHGVFTPLDKVDIEEGTIVEVLIPIKEAHSDKRPSIKDLPFYGIWADREDITDGVSYVDKLRDAPRG